MLAYAQSLPVEPKFEVASVKRADRCEFNSSIDPASVTLSGVPLKAVLMEAFQVRTDQIEGPAWLDADCVEISAKIPAGARRDQVPAMLLSLLRERFRLAARIETRSRPGYALVVDKDGPKFKEDNAGKSFMGARPAGSQVFGFAGNGRFKGAVTMAQFASVLSRRGYGPVQDLTGLTSKYDIDLSWTPDPAFEPGRGNDAASASSPAASLFTALRESLGLRLERRNVQVEAVVIERIERVPTDN